MYCIELSLSLSSSLSLSVQLLIWKKKRIFHLAGCDHPVSTWKYFLKLSYLVLATFCFLCVKFSVGTLSSIQFQHVIMELIKKELKSWSKTFPLDNVPKAPTGSVGYVYMCTYRHIYIYMCSKCLGLRVVWHVRCCLS